MPMPLTEFPYSFKGGENVATDPIPGITVIKPPETPLLVGTP